MSKDTRVSVTQRAGRDAARDKKSNFTGGTSPRFYTLLPPPSRSGPKAPRGGGGFREGRWGGGRRLGGSAGGGVQVGRFGVVGWGRGGGGIIALHSGPNTHSNPSLG